ncbi:hypothetical protein, partial [Streptomyces sp. MMG1533]|uniref:hypothetical protein n=1 Tax=Streptomyces sp. MMG1533 TaxID=1415546 RepID=UPI001F3FD52E
DHHTGGERVSECGHTGPAVGGRGRRHRGHEKGSFECDGCRLSYRRTGVLDATVLATPIGVAKEI